MSSERFAASALIVGSCAGIATMTFHPTAGEVVGNAGAAGANTVAELVHALAVLGQSLLVAGALGLTQRLQARRDLATTAFIFFATAAVASMIAAAASGYIAPGVLRGFNAASPEERAVMTQMLRYTGVINRSFATLYVMAAGVAFLGWSAAMLLGRELNRGLGWSGLLLGSVMIIGIFSGALRPDRHGFALVVFGQSAWFIAVAVALWRGGRRQAAPP